MKTILTISMLLFSYLTYGQSVAFKQITVIEVDEVTKDIIKQYNTGYYMEFLVSDSSVVYQLKDHIGGTIEKVEYEITKKETLDETHVINMKHEEDVYELLIPVGKKETISLNSGGVTKIISGKIQKVK